jgi:hypothetical protein
MIRRWSGVVTLGFLLWAAGARADAPEGDKDPKGYAQYFVTYWEGKIAELGVPAKMEVDWKSVGTLDERVARAIEKAADGTHYGIQHFVRKDKYKATVIRDVKLVRIVNDASLKETETVYANVAGVVTAKMNLAKYMTSNLSLAWEDRFRLGMPAILEIDRKDKMKEIEDGLRHEEQLTRDASPPGSVRLEVRWDEFKSSDDYQKAQGKLWGMVERFLSSSNSSTRRAIEEAGGDLSAQKALVKKVQKITLGMAKTKKAPPLFTLQGTTLAVTLAPEEYQNSFANIPFDSEILRLMGATKK